MTIAPVLNALDLSAIRAGYAANQYLSLCPNTVAWAARINSTPTGNSFAEALWTGTASGAYTDVEIGMTLIVSDVNDIAQPKFTGRIRKAPTATTLYFNETSASIESGDYFWVIWDFRIWEKLSREVSGGRRIDWDLQFTGALNSGLPPFVYDLDSYYAGYVDVSTGKYRVAFDISALPATSGSGVSISTYVWTFPTGSGSIVSGSQFTSTVTYDFNPGWWWVKLVVTDTGSRSVTRWIAISAHDDTTNPPILGFTGASIDGSADNGWSATVEAFDGVDDVLDGTLAIIWRDTTYYGEPSDSTDRLIYRNVEFGGRLRQQEQATATDSVASLDRRVSYQLEGPAQQLARTIAPLILMQNSTVAGFVNIDNIPDLTLWRCVVNVLSYYSTFMSLHSVEFDIISDVYEIYALETKEQNLLDSIKNILFSRNARFEFAPWGSAYAYTDARYLSEGSRNALPVVATLDNRDWYNIDIQHEHIRTVGQVIGFGASYQTAIETVVSVASLAPGSAQDTPPGKAQLNGQIILADRPEANVQDILNTRIGYHFEAVNPTDQLNVEMLDGYHILIPTFSEYTKWDIDGTDTIGSKTYDDTARWFLINISHSHSNETGSRQVTATFQLETFGEPAQTYKPPAPGVVEYALPNMPTFNPYGASMPMFPFWNEDYTPPYYGLSRNAELFDEVLKDGNTVLAWGWATAAPTNSEAYLSRNFLYSVPTWKNIIPPGANHQIKYVVFKDPMNSREAYLLSYDGSSDSYFWYTEDIFAAEIEWVGTQLVGVEWDYIRVSANGLYIVRTNGVTTLYSYSDDLTSGLGSNTHVPLYNGIYGWPGRGVVVPRGHWINSNGRTGGGSVVGDNIGVTPDSGGSQLFETAVIVDLGAEYLITEASFWYKFTVAAKNYAARIFAYDAALTFVSLLDEPGTNSSTSYQQKVWSGQEPGIRYLVFDIDSARSADGGADAGYIDDIEISYASVTGTSGTRYSTDDGATFSAEQSAGLSGTSDIGFDAIKIGSGANDPAVLGGFYQTKITTTAGGAYIDESNHPVGIYPTALVIPFWQLTGGNTTKNINTAAPDYIVASNLTDGTGNSIYKVRPSGATNMIIPATSAVAIGPQCVAVSQWSSNYIAVIFTVVLQNKLFVSTDGGASWSAGLNVGTPAPHVRWRKGDRQILQLFLATANGLEYSRDRGATLTTKPWPGAGQARGIEVYG